MFKWYQYSVCCFVFLPDVHRVQGEQVGTFNDSQLFLQVADCEPFNITQFKASTWFTRAWTVQELLAPRRLRFFNSSFDRIGSRKKLDRLVSEVTDINVHCLQSDPNLGRHHTIRFASAAERMRWASSRKATREEDIAYSLLGIFGVNMPLLYGEGNRAFSRLQSEIIKASPDNSIFAWRNDTHEGLTGLLAPNIECFSDARLIRRKDRAVGLMRHPYEETNLGIKFPMWLSSIPSVVCVDTLD